MNLSREHHFALVLAQRAKRADSEGSELSRLASEIAEAFEREIERHFRAEERGLLPALESAGHKTAVERTLSEHAELRGMAVQLRSGNPASLRSFGELLESHVRFEERELFMLAEALNPEMLAAIEKTLP